MAATWWNRLARLLARFTASKAVEAPASAEPLADAEASFPALLSALSRAGVEPDAHELAEVLWLASHLDPPSSPAPREVCREQARPAEAIGEAERPEPKRPAPEGPRPQARPAQDVPRLKVHPRAGGGGARPAVAWRAPGVPVLPDALGLARSLRPLSRRVPSRTQKRLDEDAIAEAIAGHRLASRVFWEPVWVPAAERWFELALAVDCGATMVVWAPVLEEFRRLLDYSGAFQRVRVFTLAFDPATARFNDEPVREFLADKDVESIADHFFVKDGMPYLVLVARYRRRHLASSPKRMQQFSFWQES